MNYLQPPERLDRLAREYALGTLTGRARRRFEQVLLQSPQAVRAVAAWQERYTVLADGLPPMVPRAAVWQGLEQRLFAPAPRHRSSWRHLLGGMLGGMLAGAVVCSVVLRLEPGLAGLEPRAEALPASYVGLLTDAAGTPTVLASARRHGRQLTVKLLKPVAVPAGKVAQLWAYPQDGGAAFPVGVLPGNGSTVLALADTSERLFFKVSRLGVSFENAPANAGSLPTAPLVLSGPCVKLW